LSNAAAHNGLKLAGWRRQEPGFITQLLKGFPFVVIGIGIYPIAFDVINGDYPANVL
jgi:hypothetical protein